MTQKRREPKGTLNRKRKRQKESNQKSQPLSFSSCIKALGATVTFLSLLSAPISFLPKISVGPTATTDPHESLRTLFNLKNDGSVSIHDVTAWLCPGNLYEPSYNVRLLGGPMQFSNWRVSSLAPGDSVSLPFDHSTTGFPNAQANIVFSIHFRPDWWPWAKERDFSYSSVRAADGTWKWKEVPTVRPCR